jgi:HlyD family secretion protein
MESGTDSELPRIVVNRERNGPAPRRRWFRFRKIYLLLLLLPVFMFSGAVIGMYFQPPGLKIFYELTGLQPGGGSESPIALPPDIEIPREMVETMQATDVVGLARLMPEGDVSIVAAPYGAGDARVAEILVAVGDRVEKGAPVARLDNADMLESAVLLAEANLAVKDAALAQTKAATLSGRDEAQALLDQALSAEAAAKASRERTAELFSSAVASRATMDSAAAAEMQAVAAVKKAEATLARFTALALNDQPDVIVAARNRDAAEVDLTRARRDLSRAVVVAPITGTILDIHATAGQRPPLEGIMEMGFTDRMTAEAEIWQDRIARVAPGQPVEIAATPLGMTFQGRVRSIGLTVGRQGLVSDDTAANTDARVVRVIVALDDAASAAASRYTNLEVIARIDTRVPGPGDEPAGAEVTP